MRTSVKTCFKCNTELPMDQFYKHPEMTDGHLGKCKTCTKLDVRRHRATNSARVRAYDRGRAKQPSRKRHIALNTKKWRAQRPEGYLAHTAVSNAVRDGRLKRLPCEVCGAVETQAHHFDYSRPLDVVWLCAVHHALHHQLERVIEKARDKRA